jgi:outer membrane receptor protein involved in Fe transport
VPFNRCFTAKIGLRGDFDTSNIDSTNIYFPGDRPFNATQNFLYFGNPAAGVTDFERDHETWMLYGTTEYKVNDNVTLTSGAAHSDRPPTLTELYAMDPFLAILQQGFTSVIGNPDLRTEKLWQIDLGTRAKYDYFRAGANGYVCFVQDYITYSAVDLARGRFKGFDPIIASALTVQYTNTDLALLTGFELYAEYDATDYFTPFMTMTYVAGWDETRDHRGDIIPGPNTSTLGFHGSSVEPLPGIPPLDTRIGIRLHESIVNPHYGVELSCRFVAPQDSVASSLGELKSGGFNVWDTRAYWQAREHLLLVAGINNIFDRDYREHLDLRTGVPLGPGVREPGINPYLGIQMDW